MRKGVFVFVLCFWVWALSRVCYVREKEGTWEMGKLFATLGTRAGLIGQKIWDPIKYLNFSYTCQCKKKIISLCKSNLTKVVEFYVHWENHRCKSRYRGVLSSASNANVTTLYTIFVITNYMANHERWGKNNNSMWIHIFDIYNLAREVWRSNLWERAAHRVTFGTDRR